MEDNDSVHLEVKQGTLNTGESVWKDVGSIQLLDSPPLQDFITATEPASFSTASSPPRRALPKQAKKWLLSNNSVTTKKDRQNLYLFRNAPDGGRNTNLLMLLHGAGDSHRPFDRLAQQMSLPQTATLSMNSKVCGIELPFGLGSSWFQEIDYASGNPLPRTDSIRTATLQRAVECMDELIQRLNTVWAPERVFLLGYGAGATVAMETCRLWTGLPLGGAICIGMDELGGKTKAFSTSNRATPILVLSHDSKLLKECKDEYEMARGMHLGETYQQPRKGMISGPHEMEAVMKFLSKRLVLSMQLPQTKEAT